MSEFQKLKERHAVVAEEWKRSVNENHRLRKYATQLSMIQHLATIDETVANAYDALMVIMQLKYPEWREEATMWAKYGDVDEIVNITEQKEEE